jgi:hypothetical protein
LPFLDLLHLDLLAVSRADVYQWGRAVVRHLLTASQGPSAALAGPYFGGLGMKPTARELRAFVAAYWLEQVSHQLGSYLDRRRDPTWIRRNVTEVLAALAPAGSHGRA